MDYKGVHLYSAHVGEERLAKSPSQCGQAEIWHLDEVASLQVLACKVSKHEFLGRFNMGPPIR